MFKFHNGFLCLQQGDHAIKLKDIAQKRTNPFYLYDLDGMKDWYQLFRKSLPSHTETFYAMKANNNFQVLKTFQEEGSGVDVVSGGEITLAEKTGFQPNKMIFSGVGKSQEEIEMALQWDLLQINVESLEELKAIHSIAKNLNKIAPIALRVNPDVDIESHPYIRTGRMDHKFGIDTDQIPQVLEFIRQNKKTLDLQGLSQHIGSQIFDLRSTLKAAQSLKSLYETLIQEGFNLKTLDLGGGLGVDYQAFGLEKDRLLLKEYGQMLKKLFENFSGRIFLEPGRFLTARFGMLCVRVEYVKKTPHKTFAIVNSGMHHFLRPALYQAAHQILPFQKNIKQESYDVVGTICETGDIFGKDVNLPSLKAKDWLALADTGAYGHVMANHYNLQVPVEEAPFSKGVRLNSPSILTMVYGKEVNHTDPV